MAILLRLGAGILATTGSITRTVDMPSSITTYLEKSIWVLSPEFLHNQEIVDLQRVGNSMIQVCGGVIGGREPCHGLSQASRSWWYRCERVYVLRLAPNASRVCTAKQKEMWLSATANSVPGCSCCSARTITFAMYVAACSIEVPAFILAFWRWSRQS